LASNPAPAGEGSFQSALGRKQRHAIAILFVTLLVIVPQYYINVAQPNLDWTVAVYAVVLPGILGSAVFLALGERVYLYVFLAFLPSLTDDSPVNLDSVYTWPEVTSGLQHVASEVLLHALTIIFLYLAVRAAFRVGGDTTPGKSIVVWLLAMAAFVAASVSIIPLPTLQAAIAANWYPIDIVAHSISLGLLSVALWVAAR
jgi:hypothetical protein